MLTVILPNGQHREVRESDLRFWRPGYASVAFGQTRERAEPGDVPYVRESSDSRWCVPVRVLAPPAELNSHERRLTPLALAFGLVLRGEVAR